MPTMSKLGCNAGTCHGAQAGKNGFKLSLRGYDPVYDVRALTDDLASRRVNIASPAQSLMLLKPTAAVPHTGGQAIVGSVSQSGGGGIMTKTEDDSALRLQAHHSACS